MGNAAARAATAEAELNRLLDDLVASGVVPGGVAVVVTREGLAFRRAFGRRATEPAAEPATLDTLWDCASLTKPLVTASLLLRLRARGAVAFDEPADRHVPELTAGRRAGGSRLRAPTVGELLVHAGGLPPWEPLYAVAPGGLEARAAWLGEHREEPGGRAVYGCPGYQVLGLLTERMVGRPFPEAAADELWPGRDDLYFPLPRRLRERAAPTERGNAFERELAGDRAGDYEGYRDELIRGETHDHSAHTLGGAAGNAGLFGTAEGVAYLAGRFLRAGDFFTRQDLAELVEAQSPPSSSAGESEPRTWGFQLAASADSPAGPDPCRHAFGHVGFTGTSVMVDPERQAAYVLLTNRIHPRWTQHAFNADRRRFHSAAARLVEAGRGH